MPSSFFIGIACGIGLLASAVQAVEVEVVPPASATAALVAVRAQVATALAKPSLVVTGTIVTLVDGKPLSTSTFTGYWKQPARWLISWRDSGIGTFSPTGTVWGDGAVSHLQFTGSAGVQSNADAELTIGAATGISHSIAPWLHGLFHGRPEAVLADDGVVSQRDGDTIVASGPQAGRSTRVTISHGLITAAETVTDTRKTPQMELPVMDDAELAKVLARQGGTPTKEQIDGLREALAQAQTALATSTAVFTERYTFTWRLDATVGDAELLPEPVAPDQPATGAK